MNILAWSHRWDEMNKINQRALTTLVRFLSAALASAIVMTAQAQTLAYNFTAPTGWIRTDQGALISYAPPDAPVGSARLTLLQVKPNQADFEAQFAAERGAFERLEGLREPQAVPAKRGHSKNGEYALYVAIYNGKAGVRYVCLFPLSNKGAFGMLALVTDSNATFNRYSKLAAASFETLQLTDDAARLATENLNLRAKDALPSAVVSSAPALGGTVIPAEVAGTNSGGGARLDAENGERVSQSGLVNGKPQGLFVGMSVLSGNPVLLLFLDHGRVFQQFPRGGLNKVDWEFLVKNYPNSTGEWSVTNGKLALRWSGGGVWEDMITPTPNGMTFKGKNYYAASSVNLSKLSGKYEGRQSTAWLNGGLGQSLTRATTIAFDGKGGFSFDSTVGGNSGNAAVYHNISSSGNVTIDGYDAVFQFKDGHNERMSMVHSFPDDDPSIHDTFILSGVFYVRQKP